MSDFGAMIAVKRCDGARMATDDFAKLDEAIRKVRTARNWTNAIGEPFLFDLSFEFERRAGIILLSRYWGEGIADGTYGRSMEAILEADQLEAKAVGIALKGEIRAVLTSRPRVFIAGPEGVRAETTRDDDKEVEYELEIVCSDW